MIHIRALLFVLLLALPGPAQTQSKRKRSSSKSYYVCYYYKHGPLARRVGPFTLVQASRQVSLANAKAMGAGKPVAAFVEAGQKCAARMLD